MRTFLFLKPVFLLLTGGFLLCSFLQTGTPSVKETDRKVKQILTSKKDGRYAKKSLADMSPSGGAVTGYYSGKKLVLIEQIYGHENGMHAMDLYFDRDSLIYVVEEIIELAPYSNEDPAFNTYAKKHTNADGELDLSQWPKITETENHYYFKNDQLIQANGRNHGKKMVFTPEQLSEKQSAILLRAVTHREELNR